MKRDKPKGTSYNPEQLRKIIEFRDESEKTRAHLLAIEAGLDLKKWIEDLIDKEVSKHQWIGNKRI